MFEIILSEVLCVAIMDAQEIMDMIPNRYPICYIDYVDELVPGEKIIATKNGYTLSGMDRDSMPDFFIQKRGHLLSPRYTINSPQKS